MFWLLKVPLKTGTKIHHTVGLLTPRTRRSSIKAGFLTTEEEHTKPSGILFFFSDQLNLLNQADHSLRYSYLHPLRKTLPAGHQTLLPQHQSEPRLYCFFFFFFFFFQRTAVSAFTFVQTQNHAEKYIQQEDMTITAMPVHINVCAEEDSG